MSELNAIPAFGGKLKLSEYYEQVSAAISTLRPQATLRTIADHLNRSGFLTPRGLPWDRKRLASFLSTATI